MSACLHSTVSAPADATLLGDSSDWIGSKTSLFVISRSPVQIGSLASLSIQHHNNTQFKSSGGGQFPGQAIWTTIIDSIDNKNFVAGLKNTSFEVSWTLYVGPAAVKLVTGVAERDANQVKESHPVYHDTMRMDPVQMSMVRRADGSVKRGVIHNTPILTVQGFKSPAVSNHSTITPSAARPGRVRNGPSGDFNKEALCSTGSRRVQPVGASASYPTDHLGSFVRSVEGTVVSLTCRRSSLRMFFGDRMDRHIGRATRSKE